jgi:hypothetical protein
VIAALLVALAAAQISPPLEAILTAFARDSDPVHAAELVAAVKASPALADQLSALAEGGRLKGFALTAATAARTDAWIDQGVIHLTPRFMDEQTHPPHALPDADYGRNNPDELVFVLGYFTSRLALAADIDAADARIEAQAQAIEAATPKGGAPDFAALIRQSRITHAGFDAISFLQGFNDEMNAAVAAKGEPLTAVEAFDLLRKGVNSRVIGAAAALPPERRLVPGGNFAFPINQRNIDAVTEVLLKAAAAGGSAAKP